MAPNRNMHRVLRYYFNGKLQEMADYSIKLFAVAMEPDEIYDELLNDPAMAATFRAAAQMMHRSGYYASATVSIGTSSPIVVKLSLPPTERTRCYLMPETVPTLSPKSKLGRALLEQARIADDWMLLKFVFGEFSDEVPLPQLAFMFPWLADMAADLKAEMDETGRNQPSWASQSVRFRWADIFRATGEQANSISGGRCENELRDIIARRIPRDFPRLSRDVYLACSKGKTLISQYRMVKGGGHEPPAGADYIHVDTDRNLGRTRLGDQVKEILEAWVRPMDKAGDQ